MATMPLHLNSLDALRLDAAPLGRQEESIARKAFRWTFYPMVVVLAVSAHLFLAQGLAPAQHSLATGAVSLACLALFLLCERLMPFRAAWNENQGDLATDAIQTNVILPVVARFSEVLLAIGATWLSANVFGGGLFPVHVPFILQVILALAIAELAYYGMHRAGHTVRALWSLHAVHHGTGRVYSLNAGRFHVFDAFLSSCAYLGPMILLGAPTEVVALIATLNAVTGFMEHVNIDFEVGPLNRLFNTAQLHRWHHAEDSSLPPCNFGKVLSIWDQVFGTYYLPEGEVGAVGIGPDEAPVPTSILGQTLYPWKRRA
ncbi:Fatty acid hydroxylase superfamily protein [compost metagenome]